MQFVIVIFCIVIAYLLSALVDRLFGRTMGMTTRGAFVILVTIGLLTGILVVTLMLQPSDL